MFLCNLDAGEVHLPKMCNLDASSGWTSGRHGKLVTWLARKFYRFAPFDARTSVPLAHVLAKLPAMAARWSAEPLFTLEVLDGDAESGGMGTGNMLDKSEHAAARRIKKVRGEAREISKEEESKAARRDERKSGEAPRLARSTVSMPSAAGSPDEM